MVTYNDVDYFYVYHLQGDVVALIDANGTQVVEYGYDAWGNPISKSGSMVATLGSVRKTYLDIENMFTMKKLSCIIIRNVGSIVKKVLMK